MNAEKFGKKIYMLRCQNGFTQKELANMLHVSDKAISKWENGLAYPEITQLPVLSGIFGVSSDYLLKSDNLGIAIAGNIITDIVNVIDKYPQKNMLANVLSSGKAVGGCVPNTAIDLAKIDSSLFVSAIGRIGNDDNGRFVLSQMQRFGVDTGGIIISEDEPTSFAYVMSDEKTGERTFFSYKGANKKFGLSDVNMDSLHCEIFHIGYACLLDELDKPDKTYGTGLARLLCMLQGKGIKTSIDAISDDAEGYAKKIIHALKYCDYVIINEIESGMVTGLSPRHEDGSLNVGNIKKAMQELIRHGVKEKVIVHCSEAGFMLTADGEFFAVPSLELPDEYIKGSVGAGDAYAAGCLYGIYNGYGNTDILEFASCAAAANLSATDSISGMKNKDQICQLTKLYKRKPPIK